MNKEKIDLSKPKKEYEKFQKESESLVDELKIDKEEQEEEILEEELEAKFWEDLYKEKLEEVLDDKDFKEATISNLKHVIKKGKSGDYENASSAIRNISSYKNLGIFENLVEEKLEELKNNENFKWVAIHALEDEIQRAQNGFSDINGVFKNILVYKSVGIFEDALKDEKIEIIKNDENFKEVAIGNLESNIKIGQGGNGSYANWVLKVISVYRNLGIFNEVIGEKLKEIKDDEGFKEVVIGNLKDNIKEVQNGHGNSVKWVLESLFAYKNISKYYQKLAENKKAIKARDDIKTESISKRPEIK